jgi:hypothetical protein
MRVAEVDKDIFLTTTIHNPYPSRSRPDEVPVSERMLPVVYTCEGCGIQIDLPTVDIKKHWGSAFSNLNSEDNELFKRVTGALPDGERWFLDFYCPTCSQATKFVINGGASGYWGEFEFRIESIFVLKQGSPEDRR